MQHKAKIFFNGRSQAVRLPVNFRFDSSEVYIRRDEATGDVILSRKPSTWNEFFQMLDHAEIPDDFMKERDQSTPRKFDL